MASPLFNMFGSQAAGPQAAFTRFMNANRGKDPNEMIRQIVASGKISQQQLDQVQRTAQQMSGMFDSMRSAFGF